MTEVNSNDLNDFFSAHKKKDKKKKNKNANGPTEEETAKAATTSAAEAKAEPTPAAATQKPKEVPNFADDSSDEEANIVLGDNIRSKLKDKKDVDAVKRHEEEKKQQDDGLGWGFGGRGANDKKAKQAEPEVKPKGPREINFGGGKPSFMKSMNNSKVVTKNQNEFPELGDFRKQEVSKKDGNYGAAGSASASHAPAERQERPKPMEMKKPVFTGFARLNVGTGEEDSGARKYTYDMDKIRGSTASTKPSGPRPEGERQGFAGDGGERRQQRPRREAAADSGFGGADDFETVTDKTRKKPQAGAGGPRRFD